MDSIRTATEKPEQTDEEKLHKGRKRPAQSNRRRVESISRAPEGKGGVSGKGAEKMSERRNEKRVSGGGG